MARRNYYPTGALDDITTDILGLLPKTLNDNDHIIIVTGRYRKLTRVVPMSKTTSPYIAAVMLNQWILPYGTLRIILSDNGPQFVAVFWTTVCSILCIQRKMTTALHPHQNGQA